MWVIIGSLAIYGICGLTEKYDFITNWPPLTKGIFILLIVIWIVFVSYLAIRDQD